MYETHAQAVIIFLIYFALAIEQKHCQKVYTSSLFGFTVVFE